MKKLLKYLAITFGIALGGILAIGFVGFVIAPMMVDHGLTELCIMDVSEQLPDHNDIRHIEESCERETQRNK